ncbi:Calx-beta domain-containing protein [Chitinophaga vietnamensis]|uniref:Calx-beta domain-containing protein n=1 Tax=Chitinophaga vietnamensis TaxID=2593957 RepID=UPI0011A3F8BC|nr:Calx-beta domain-containing protein [Chitinophaga vietnamensis]
MLLLSHPMKSTKKAMPCRIAARCGMVLVWIIGFVINAHAQTKKIINPGGGLATTNDLRIEIDPSGSYSVYRLGNAETYQKIPTGIVSTMIFQDLDNLYVSSELTPSICEISDVMGKGTTAEPYRVNMIGTVSGAGFNFFNNMTMMITISYVSGTNYFYLDYTFFVAAADMPGGLNAVPHLYLSEYNVLQEALAPTAPGYPGAAALYTKGFIEIPPPVPTGTTPKLVGLFRGIGTPASGPFTHVLAARDQFSTYYSGVVNSRNQKKTDGFSLYNTCNFGQLPSTNRGIAVEISDQNKPLQGNVAQGTSVLVGYGTDTTFNSDYIPLQAAMASRPVSTGSTPVIVQFAQDTLAGLEGNTGDNHDPHNFNIIVSGGKITAPLYVKMQVVPATPGDTHVAIDGVDYTNFQNGFMIPPGDYSTPTPVTVNGFTVIGNNKLEYDRHFKVQLVPVGCNGLLTLGPKVVATYVIQDDENHNIFFTPPSPASIDEGNTATAQVSLQSGVTTTEAFWVKLSGIAPTTGVTATPKLDYILPDSVLIDINKGSANITIRAVKDSVLERPELFRVKADAVVLGHPATVTGADITINDMTRLDPTLTAIQLIKDPAVTEIKEGNLYHFTASLPFNVTTDIPITVTLAPAGTATNGVDYTLSPSPLVIANHSTTLNIDVPKDSVIDGDKTLQLSGTGNDGITNTYHVNDTTLTIIDANYPLTSPVTLHTTATAIDEGNATGADITLVLPNGLKAGKDMVFNISRGVTGTAANTAYSGLPATITIPAGQNASAPVKITAPANLVLDDSSMLVINFSHPDVNIKTGDSLKLVIADKTRSTSPGSDKITLTAQTALLNEGDSTKFQIALPTGITSAKDIQISLAANPASVATAADFTLNQPNIVLRKGLNSALTDYTVVTATSDLVLETDEQLIIDGTAPNYTITSAAFKIKDMTRLNAANTVISFKKDPAVTQIKEGNLYHFSASLPDNVTTEVPITVNLTYSGTATYGTDYTLTPQSLTITNHAANFDLNVPTDNRIDGDQTLILSATVTDGTSTAFTVKDTTLIIKDANYPLTTPVTLQLTTNSIDEGNTTGTNLTVAFPGGLIAGKDFTFNIGKGLTTTAANGAYTALPATITIPAGKNASLPVAITAPANTVLDDDSYVIITLASADPNIATGDSLKLSIADKTRITSPGSNKITMTAQTDPLNEGDSTRFVLSLPAGITSAKDVSIALSRNTGSAASATDFSFRSPNIVLPKFTNNTTTPFTVINALQDKIIENDEQLIIDGTAANYTVASASFIIKDMTRQVAANRALTIAPATQQLAEGASNDYIISLPAGVTTEIPLTINFSTSGTATAGADYTLPATATLSSGDTVHVPLVIKTDNIVEGPETIHVAPSVTDGSAYVYTIGAADVTIIDAQYPVTLQLTATPASIKEGDQTALNVTLPNNWIAGFDISVNVIKDAASTLANTDHSAVPGTFVIKKGQTAATPATITAFANNMLGDGGTIIVTGSTSDNNIKVRPDTITVADNTINQPGANQMTMSSNISIVPEGSSADITISLAGSYVSKTPITVTLSRDAASVAGNSDATLTTTQLVLPAATHSQTFAGVLKANTDLVLERDKSYILDGAAAPFVVNNVPLTIKDMTRASAANTTLSVAAQTPAPYKEGDKVNLNVTLPTGVTTEVPINITLQPRNGTAQSGADYNLPNAIIYNKDTVIVLDLLNDNLVEGPETLNIPATATDGISTFTINPLDYTITDKQYPLPSPILIKATPDSIDEGGAGTKLSVQLPNGWQAGRLITVNLNKGAASTATTNDHSALPASITMNPGDNETASSTLVSAYSDLVLEDNESLIVQGNTGDINMPVRDTTVIIRDKTHENPLYNVLKLTGITTGTHVLEGNSYTLQVSLAPGVTCNRDIAVGISIDPASAAKATDVSGLPSTVVIPAGQSAVQFSFTAVADKVIEPDELLRLVAVSQNYPGLTSDHIDLTIDDATRRDPANLQLAVKIDSTSLMEGHSSQVTVGFTADQIVSSEDIIINIARDPSSTADDADYSGMPAQVKLPAGTHSLTYTLNAINDHALEGDEQLVFKAALQPGSFAYTLQQPAAVLIPETGDMRVILTKGSDAAEPATNGSFVFSLPGTDTAAADVKVVFYVSSIAGTTNIAPIPTSVTIPAGKTSVSVPVNVIDNYVIEGDEQVKAALMLAQMKRFNKFIGFNVNEADTVIVTVHDDESDATGPKALARQMLVEKVKDAAEPATQGAFRIRFTDTQLSAVKDVTVNYTVGGSATPDVRYQKLGGSVTIPAGQHEAIVTVNPIDDNIVEGDENVQLQLKTVSSTLAGVTWPISSQSTADVIIHDNDTLVLNIASAVATAVEGDAIQFTFNSPTRAKSDVPVRLQIDQDSARSFATSAGTLSGNVLTVNLPAMQTQYTFTITVTDNDVNDDNGFLKATILPYNGSNSTPLYTAGANNVAQVAITDNDPLSISFAALKFSAKEGNLGERLPLDFKLKMSRKSSRPITVNYVFEEDTNGTEMPFMSYKAIPGKDFEDNITQTIIPPMASEGTLTVRMIGDTVFEMDQSFIVHMMTVSVPSGQNTPTLTDPVKATGVILNDDPMCGPCDTDGDGLTNDQEDINHNGNPWDDDSDGDGIPNFLDLDSANDGVPDSVSRFYLDKNRQLNYVDGVDGKIRVYPGISPNHDGMGNEVMYIENINKYPDNKVVIFNRWGGTVFKTNNYDNKSNNFDGHANTGGSSGQEVPDGSYFYVIEVRTNGKTERYTGYIVIKR